ncbi:MAG: hypothetical protein WBE37_01475 [Bryobacteraceae bacterium]
MKVGGAFVHDLTRFAKEFVAAKLYSDSSETAKDKAVIDAINGRDLDRTARTEEIIKWLSYYKVLMFSPRDRSLAIGKQIIDFADGPRKKSLDRDKDGIVSEFNRLGELIGNTAASIKTGKIPKLTSLTSKALWCCYPDDVPIFDNNAASALRVISRLCHLSPAPKQSEYACSVDLWLKVYKDLDPVMSAADLSGCPYRIRLLDRLLWRLGQSSFYDKS